MMMRIIGALCLSVALLAFVSGCGEQEPEPKQPKQPAADQPETPAKPAPPAQDKPKDHPAH